MNMLYAVPLRWGTHCVRATAVGQSPSESSLLFVVINHLYEFAVRQVPCGGALTAGELKPHAGWQSGFAAKNRPLSMGAVRCIR